MLTTRRDEIAWVHSEGVYEIVPMQDCQDTGKKLLELIWVNTDKSVDPAHKKLRSRLYAREHKTEQGMIPRSLLASQLFSLIPPLEALKALVSIMMSVSWSSIGKPLKLRHYDISRAHLQRTSRRLTCIHLPAEDRQKYDEDKVGRLSKSMLHIWQLDYVILICGDLVGFRRGKHSAALFHNPNECAKMALHGDDFVCVR